LTVEALEFINLIRPNHDRKHCDDERLNNGFFSRNGETWHGRCARCMWLQIAAGEPLPEGFDADECYG
jgi:hypothetical protein